MATREDGWHSLATAVVALVPPAGRVAWLDTSLLLHAGAPADRGRWCKNPKQSDSVGSAGPSSWDTAQRPARIPRGCRAELSPGEAGASPGAGSWRPDQRWLRSLQRQPQQKLHISTVVSWLLDLPVLGRDPLFPAVSINEFKHFPAQQLEPLLVLHLCLINEIASNLNIS